ncbi:MAG: biopolymer transporter ExbD [Planctomycetes bacterium]|nr:biopolymer transporter ExbD [Planctomycetota bacterium]
MAGGGGEANADNPLPLNVVPLIDVIFCLLLFFMCSFHFKTLEGKMDAWLPQDKGNNKTQVDNKIIGEVRITLEWDRVQLKTLRKFGRTPYDSDEELGQVMRDQFDRNKANGNGEVPVIIQPNTDVPWLDVIHVMDIVHQKNLPKMEFALAKSELVIPEPH